jgi:hypothetical protein
MKGKIKILAFIAMVSMSGLAFGQAGTASISLDTSTIMIGDQVKMHLELTVPAKSNVFWPEFIGDSVVMKIEILKHSRIDTLTISEGMMRFHQALLITSFDSGYYEIGPVPFKYIRENDTVQHHLQSSRITLHVTSPEVDMEAGLRPVKPPVHAPVTLAEILPWILGILLVAGLVFIIIYIIRKRKNKEPVFTFRAKPALPPHVQALQDLEALRVKKLWQSGKVKKYHTELTDIVRIYIEKRFHVQALEMTTDEIMSSLEKAGVDPDPLRILNGSMVLADLVKFAKEQPLPAENDASMKNCTEFVNNTRPAPETIEQSNTE